MTRPELTGTISPLTNRPIGKPNRPCKAFERGRITRLPGLGSKTTWRETQSPCKWARWPCLLDAPIEEEGGGREGSFGERERLVRYRWEEGGGVVWVWLWGGREHVPVSALSLAAWTSRVLTYVFLCAGLVRSSVTGQEVVLLTSLFLRVKVALLRPTLSLNHSTKSGRTVVYCVKQPCLPRARLRKSPMTSDPFYWLIKTLSSPTEEESLKYESR